VAVETGGGAGSRSASTGGEGADRWPWTVDRWPWRREGADLLQAFNTELPFETSTVRALSLSLSNGNR
jgi:hypothetical protein